MEAIFAVVAAIVALLILDVAAVVWGADSREPMTDDHRR